MCPALVVTVSDLGIWKVLEAQVVFRAIRLLSIGER